MNSRLLLLGVLILLTGFLIAGFALQKIIQTFATWVSEGHKPPPPQHHQATYLAIGGGLLACIGFIISIAGVTSKT